MSRLQSSDLVASTLAQRYERDGFVTPLRAIDAARAIDLRARLEAVEAAHGGSLPPAYRSKPHLLFTWLAELIRHPAILDEVEPVLGPDILCWNTSFFIKNAHDPNYVSWHQDSTYWGLSEPAVLTAWVAFTPSTSVSGCMKMIPGSHRGGQLPHADTFDPRNLLTRGQEVAVKIDETQAVELPLEPGEFSMHHVGIVHNSEPNRSDDRRIGYAIRYIPTRIRQLASSHDSATLVRGRDDYHHFEPEPRPVADLDPAALAFHAEVMRRHAEIIYKDARERRW